MGKVRDRPGGLETFTFSTTDRLLVRQCHSTLNVVAYATVCRHADMPHSCGTGNERIRAGTSPGSLLVLALSSRQLWARRREGRRPAISKLVAKCRASDLTDGASAWLATELGDAAPSDEARPESSLNSALRSRESGFAKIGQSWVAMFVNEDHAKAAVFVQNRFRNYPDRAYPIPDGLEQSLLLSLQDDLEHGPVIIDKRSPTCIPRNTPAVGFWLRSPMGDALNPWRGARKDRPRT